MNNPNQKIRKVLWIFARAVLCVVLINISQLAAYCRHGGTSVSSLQDVVDESLYLRSAIDQGNYMPQEAIYFEHAKQLNLGALLTHWRPDQTYSHFMVGRVANLLGLRLYELNLVLDLVCGVLGYLLLFIFFRILLGSKHARLAELSALIFLCFPWLSSIENWVTMHTLWPSYTAIMGGLVAHSVLPIQEGLEAQLSTLWFGITLVAFALMRRRSFQPAWLTLALGAIAGLGIYTYVLEWLAISALLPLLIATTLVQNREQESVRRGVGIAALFFVGNLLVALPAILQIMAVRSSKHIFIDDAELYRQAFYLPVEWLFLLGLGALLLYLSRSRLTPTQHFLTGAILATIFAELLLLNIQAIAGFATVGIFIVISFTRPLLSALIIALPLSYFSDRKFFRWIFTPLICFFIVLAGIDNYRRAQHETNDKEGLTPLISYLQQNVPKGSVLAMLTYNDPFKTQTHEWDWRWQPNAVAALTENFLLKEAIGLEWGALSPQETISRELALGTVFTAKPTLIRGCSETLITEPKRLFFQQWVAIQLTRRYNCAQAASIILETTPCDSIRNYKLDYIIWERGFNLIKPAYLAHAGRSMWTSSDGAFEVIQLDQQRAIAALCSPQQGTKQ